MTRMFVGAAAHSVKHETANRLKDPTSCRLFSAFFRASGDSWYEPMMSMNWHIAAISVVSSPIWHSEKEC